MKLDQTTVPLVPRNTGNCIDLAIRFFSSHIRSIGEIWLSIAMPAGLLAYLISVRLEMDVRLTLAVLYFATIPLGVLLISGTSRALFGEPFAPAHTSTDSAPAFARLVMTIVDIVSALLFFVLIADYAKGLLTRTDLFDSDEIRMTIFSGLIGTLSVRLALVVMRYAQAGNQLWRVLAIGFFRRVAIAIGPTLMLFTSSGWLWLLGIAVSILAAILMLRTGFKPESLFLAPIDRQLRSRSTKELLKSEGGDLFFRGCRILAFSLLLSIVLFTTVDNGLEQLIGFPILQGRLQEVMPDMTEAGDWIPNFFTIIFEMVGFAMSDPRALAVITVVMLIAYTIARLSWFFCYIDLRVRRDLWDLELQFQQEAQRLERRTT